jgi:hypothetical protein
MKKGLDASTFQLHCSGGECFDEKLVAGCSKKLRGEAQ